MASNMDTRVVQMQFENRQFERNIAKSQKSLADFKKELNFESVSSGLANFASQIKSIDLGQLVSDVGRLADKFTGLGHISEMVMTTIQGKVRESVAAISNFAESMTTAQVSVGKQKYELLNKSVQTIMNATGKAEKDVYVVMERLNRYTDQTSYDFADMAQNIGKFTSAGIDLDKAESAMEGIANWAALSGAGIQEASRAMYNISQAMSVGNMKLIDWKSIENANMATITFKQAAIDAAVASNDLVETVNKDGSKIYKTASKYGKQVEVSATNFNETLQKGWLTNEVMLKVLNEFADTSTELGKKAYEAAQKCTTFTDVLQAWKDQISTGWMNSFRHIFGDLGESMEFLSKVCNKVGDDLSTLIDLRNDILKGWGETGGRKNFFKAILGDYEEDVNAGAYGLLDVIHDAGKLVADGFWDLLKMFAPSTVQSLWDKDDGKWRIAWISNSLKEFTFNIRRFIESIRTFFTSEVKIGDTTTTRLEMLQNTIRGIAGIFAFAYQVISGIVAFFRKIGDQLSPSFLAIEYMFSVIGQLIYQSAGMENKNKGILGFFEYLAELARPLTDAINRVVISIVNLIFRIIQWGVQTGVFEKIGNAIKSLFNTLVRVATPIADFIGKIFEVVSDLFENGINPDSLKNAGAKLKEAFKTMFKGIVDALPDSFKPIKEALYDLFGLWGEGEGADRDNIFVNIRKFFENGFQDLKTWFESSNLIKGIKEALFGKEGDAEGKGLLSGIWDWLSNLSLGDAIKTVLGGLADAIGWVISKLSTKNLWTLAKAILGFMTGVKIYKTIKSAQESMSAIGDFFKNPLKALFGGGEDDGGGFLSAVVDKILDVAKAIALIAGAIIILGAIPTDQLVKGGVALVAIMGMMVGFIAAVNAVSGVASLNTMVNYVAIAALALSIGLLVAALLPLTLVSWEGLGKMLAGLGAILLELVGFMMLTTYLPIGTAQLGGFIGFAFSIMLLVTSLLPLTAVSWEGFGKMMAGLGGVLAQLIGFMLLTSYLPIGTAQLGGFIGFAEAIAILVLSLRPLADISWEGYGKMMAGLGGVLAQLVGFMLLTSYLPIGTGQLGGFLGFAASIALLVLTLKPMADISWEGYGKMMATLGGILGEIIIFALLVKNIKLRPDTMAGLILFAGALSIVMLAFGGALGMVKGMDWGAIAAFAGGLTVLLVGMAVAIGAIGAVPITTAVKGIAVLVAGIVAIMGALSIMIPVLMGSIGNSIQSMAGRLRLVGDLVAQFTGTMNEVGDGDIDSAQHKLDKIKEMMKGLSDFKGLVKNVDDFSVAMWTLGTGLEIFSDHANKVGDLNSMGALKLLSEIQNNYEGIDTLAKMNLNNLMSNIAGLGGAMMLYAIGAKQVAEANGETGEPDEQAITAAVKVMQRIAETMVTDGEFVIPDMPAPDELTAWGVQLAALAGALVSFEQAGAGLGAGTDKALETLTFFQQLKTKLEQTHAQDSFNWIGTFIAGLTFGGTGAAALQTATILASDGTEQTVDVMTAFGYHIEALGKALAGFAASTTRVNAQTGEIEPIDYTKATDALNTFMSIKEKMPAVGGMLQWITGAQKDLVDLGTEIESLGTSLSQFSAHINGDGGEGTKFNPDDVTVATGVLDQMVDCVIAINHKMPRMSIVATVWNALFVNRTWSAEDLGNQFGELGVGLGKLGDGLMKFSTKATGEGGNAFDKDAVSTAATAMSDMADAIGTINQKMPKMGIFAKIWNFLFGSRGWTGEELGNQFGGLGDGLEKLGKGLSTFATKTNGSGFDEKSVGTATSAMESMVDFMNRIKAKLPTIGGIGAWISEFLNGHEMTMSELGDRIGELGDGLGRLGTGLTQGNWTNVKSEAIGNAFDVINQVIGVATSLANFQHANFYGSSPTIWLQNLSTIMETLTDAQSVVFTSAGMTPSQSIIDGMVSFMTQLNDAMIDVTVDQNKLQSLVMVSEILNALSNVNPQADFYTIGQNIASGTAAGIVDGTSGVINAAVNMAVDAYNAAVKALEIGSPSKLFAEIGGFVAAGMATGIVSGTSEVVDASTDMSEKSLKGASAVISTMGSLLDQNLDTNPIITPVIDMDNVYAELDKVDKRFDTTGRFGKGNIDLNNRQVVHNEDGSISTERSFSVNINGKEVLLPTVVNGKIVSEDEAIEHYYQTGEHLGKFDTWQEADAYAEMLHNRQDWYYNYRDVTEGHSGPIDMWGIADYANELIGHLNTEDQRNQNEAHFTGVYDRMDAIGEKFSTMSAKIEELGSRISQMKLVLDSGVVAGGVTQGVDQNLGRRMFYASRNN